MLGVFGFRGGSGKKVAQEFPFQKQFPAQGGKELRLCNLVAQSERATKKGVQAGGGAASDGVGDRTVGTDLVQLRTMLPKCADGIDWALGTD
jgi:hypothetical protein